MMVGQAPEKAVNMPIGDLSSAMFATIAILTALYTLKRGGSGQYIDISIVDGLVSWKSMSLSKGSQSNLSLAGLPGFCVYPAKDGKYLSLSIAGEEHFWHNLCDAIDRPELSGVSMRERARRYDELYAKLKEAFLTKTRDEWVRILADRDVPCGPVYTSPDEVFSDPQLRYRGMVAEIDEPGKEKTEQITSPLKFLGLTATPLTRPPGLGQHTKEILLGLGYSVNAVEEMRKGGVISMG